MTKEEPSLTKICQSGGCHGPDKKAICKATTANETERAVPLGKKDGVKKRGRKPVSPT